MMKNILLAILLSGCAFKKAPETVYLPFVEKAGIDHMNNDFMMAEGPARFETLNSFRFVEARSSSNAEFAFAIFDLLDSARRKCGRAVVVISCDIASEVKCFPITTMSRSISVVVE